MPMYWHLHYILLLLILLKVVISYIENMLFTLHFATINTFTLKPWNMNNFKFTLHFATINTNRKDEK